MAILKKGSRKLTVNNVIYRWRVRQKPTYCQGVFPDTFCVAVERADPPSKCTLLLEAPFPRPDNWVNYPSQAITPRMIATSIEQALAHGWQPEHPGSPFTHPLHAEMPKDAPVP